MDANEASSSVGRLGCCLTCKRNPAKYKCPRCGIVSCSLVCVTRHKEGDGCNGVRNKTRFVALNSFSDLDLLNDYRLLESATRIVDSYSRDGLKKSTRLDGAWMPRHLVLFRNACRRRGRCDLQFLPPHFERHRSNTSRFCWKSKVIFWKVLLEYPHSNSRIVLEKVPESILLYDLVCPQLEVKDDRVDCESAFAPYQAAGFGGIDVCLKVESLLKNPGQFYSLDLSKSLKENLMGKTVVENPIVVVFLKHHSSSFVVVDADDDGDVATFRSSHNDATSSRLSPEDVKLSNAFVPPPPSGQVYKSSYDYYLSYYNEKYGVSEEKCQSKNDIAMARAEKENRQSPIDNALSLVSYSGSDNE